MVVCSPKVNYTNLSKRSRRVLLTTSSLTIGSIMATTGQAQASDIEFWDVQIDENNNVTAQELTSSQEFLDDYHPDYYPTNYGILEKEDAPVESKKDTAFILSVSSQSHHLADKTSDQQVEDSICHDYVLGDLTYEHGTDVNSNYARAVTHETCSNNFARRYEQNDYNRRMQASVYDWDRINAQNPDLMPQQKYQNYKAQYG